MQDNGLSRNDVAEKLGVSPCAQGDCEVNPESWT